jgi:hypothetical protein
MADKPTADAQIPNLSGRTLGEFILREQIGQGGHAVVYRCEQKPSLTRTVRLYGPVLSANHPCGMSTEARGHLPPRVPLKPGVATAQWTCSAG